MSDASPLPPLRPLVLSVHGINTRGDWQKADLTLALNEAGFDHAALDFGTFRTMQLVLKWTRVRQIDWFRDEYTRHASQRTPSIIAHSFGTYLVARAMQKYGEVKFDRIIFCGSIVQPGYSWSTRYEHGQFRALLNDFGKKDWPVWIAEWGVSDAGPSGVSGFTDNCEALTQRMHPEFKHSDYFYKLNYTKNWVPFLRGEEPQTIAATDKPAPNYKIYVAVIAIAALLLSALLLSLWYFWPATPSLTRSNITIEEFMEKREAVGIPAIKQDYVGKEVEWMGYVEELAPSAEPPFYTIKPQERSPLNEWVSASFDNENYRHSVKRGDRIRIRGTVERVTSSVIYLRDSKVID